MEYLESSFTNVGNYLRTHLSPIVTNCSGARSVSKPKQNEQRSTIRQNKLNSLIVKSIKQGSQTRGPRCSLGIFKFNIYVAKCLEKRRREPKLMIPSAVFVPAVALQTKYSLFFKFFFKFLRNLESMPKTFKHVLPTSRRNTTGILVKSLGECCGSTVLTAACYWPWSDCIPVQRFLSVTEELNHDRSPLLLASDNVCCHPSFSSL